MAALEITEFEFVIKIEVAPFLEALDPIFARNLNGINLLVASHGCIYLCSVVTILPTCSIHNISSILISFSCKIQILDLSCFGKCVIKWCQMCTYRKIRDVWFLLIPKFVWVSEKFLIVFKNFPKTAVNAYSWFYRMNYLAPLISFFCHSLQTYREEFSKIFPDELRVKFYCALQTNILIS